MDRRKGKQGINIIRKRRRSNTYRRYILSRNAKKQGLFIFTGICLIMAALVMYLYPYMPQSPSISEERAPVIRVACNKPNQQAHVTMTTDIEGETELLFQWQNNDTDDVRVWIIIDDDYAPFTWDTMESATAVQVYTQDGKAYFSALNDAVYGTGNYAGFRMDFGENADRAHTIRIEPEDYIVKNRGECWLRIPLIGPWHNRNISKDSIVNLSHDDSEWIGKTMDGEELYFLDMQFNVIVHNPAAQDSDLVLKWASHTGRESDFCFEWKMSEAFATQIHYVDEKWQRDIDLLNALASVLIGFGLSLIYLVFADRKKKMEENQ